MKIKVLPYNPEWVNQFNQIKKELRSILVQLNPKIEHIGSTSIPNLAAKPIIDIAVGIQSLSNLDKTIDPMISNYFIYYEVFNIAMPQRRLYVGLKDKKDISKFNSSYTSADDIPHDEIHELRLCHIHIWEYESSEWNRHIAFREYLKSHPKVKSQYEALKVKLSQQSWKDGMAYNETKDDFIKKEEIKAIKWYTG